ncbi:ATP-binding protein [Streptomyces sp. NPDC005438]|uniref:ATP-binding protein n=1 Tax=Streptomyces sp. NPDC005438 TaxID=3156880 RepID=UPI0033A6F1CF
MTVDEDKVRKDGRQGDVLGEAVAVPGPSDARRQVRHLIDQHLREGGANRHATFVADALLVTSELVTNAVRHGGGLVDFRARWTAEGLWLCAVDRSHHLPDTTRAVPTEVHGRGWPLICRLARDLTIALLPEGGKRISMTVALAPRP